MCNVEDRLVVKFSVGGNDGGADHILGLSSYSSCGFLFYFFFPVMVYLICCHLLTCSYSHGFSPVGAKHLHFR